MTSTILQHTMADSIGFDFINDSDSQIDYTLLQYTTPHQHLNCPICQLPFIDPYTTSCGHTFCRMCLEESFKMTGMKCPLDRILLDLGSTNDVYPAPIIIKNLIDELAVNCLNNGRGCEWSGQRWLVKSHLISDCAYTRFECNEGGCKVLTERRYLDDADDGCVHKLVTCECGEEIAKYKQKEHLLKECCKRTTQCNGCNLSFTGKEIEEHERCCEKQYIRCLSSKFGCDWKGTKLLFETVHERNCQFIKLTPYLEMQDSTIKKLSETNQSLQTQITTILDSVIQGKVSNLGHGLLYDEVGPDTVIRSEPSHETPEDDKLHLFMELEKLKHEMAKLELSSSNHLTMMNNLIHEYMRFKDELSYQKNSMGSLRQQLHVLMMERRRSYHSYSSHSSDDETGSSLSISGIKL